MSVEPLVYNIEFREIHILSINTISVMDFKKEKMWLFRCELMGLEKQRASNHLDRNLNWKTLYEEENCLLFLAIYVRR